MLLLDDKNVEEYGLCVKELPSIPTPERDVEFIEIRGRHGSLTRKYAFKDIQYSVTLNFLEDVPFKKMYRQFKVYLFKVSKLQTIDDMEVYYKIKDVSIDDADSEILEHGEFTITFVLDSFLYEVEDYVQLIEGKDTVDNPGYDTDPILEVSCTGTGTVSINGEKITIKGVNGKIVIDAEQKNAYTVTDGSLINLNSKMYGDFPILRHGSNRVEIGGDVTQVRVTKNVRWI